MRRQILALVIIAANTLMPTVILGQKPVATKEQDDDRIVFGTNEVILDAIVKDKKGRLIKDLTVADFQISEDGVRQDVRSFRLVTRDAPAAPDDRKATLEKIDPGLNSSGDTKRSIANSPIQFGALALVYDRLSPNARKIARQASLGYVQGMRQDDFVAVFGIDLSLRVLQRFTNSEERVKAAIEKGLSHSSSTYSSATDSIADLQDRAAALQSQLDSSTSGAGAGNIPSASIGATAAQAQFDQMTLNIAQGFEHMERSQQGHATIDSLLAIIDGMKQLPGRKAMIFFSEGIALPTNVMTHFRSVISSANRANVSIYAVDAAGLRAVSDDAQSGRALTRLGQARARVASSNSDPPGSMMQDLERNEDLMRSNPDSALGDLANETGGILISNTNDPGARLRQVDDDLHAYYILTYTPKNTNFDGRFRQINVAVNRSGVEVQARRGYYALNNSYGSPVHDYEAAALAVLSGSPRPNAFVSRAAAFSFPESGKPGLVPIVVEVPPNAVNFAVDDKKKTFLADLSVVVLIKDQSQRVIKKVSNQQIVKGPLSKLATAKRGGLLFYREAELEPGNYTVAIVVYDNTTHQSSTNTATVMVPAADQSALRLSSIVFIKRAERLPPTEEKVRRPFQFGEVLVYPNLGEPVSKSASKQLTVFVTVYTPKDNSNAPKLELVITRSGRAVGQLSYDLQAPDQNGRIQYASAISLEKFQPGDYELRLTVQQGDRRTSRSEHIVVTP